jgi:branched-chain amino acid transport system ATP-binding protein
MASSGPALELSSVFAGYGRYDVVRGIDLTVAPGQAIGLLGPNGAGKTTVLRTIMGMVKHWRGSISVDGLDLGGMRTHQIARGHVAIVPEGRRLFFNQSVEDNLVLGAFRLRSDADRVRQLLGSVYELFPVLREYKARRASALSGGEQQMVAIGRMMMSDPKVMLLDEPSLGLAPLAVEAMARALKELRQRGRSLLIVEQRVDLALQVCDRVHVLSGGEIVAEELPGSLDAEGRDLIDAYLG